MTNMRYGTDGGGGKLKIEQYSGTVFCLLSYFDNSDYKNLRQSSQVNVTKDDLYICTLKHIIAALRESTFIFVNRFFPLSANQNVYDTFTHFCRSWAALKPRFLSKYSGLIGNPQQKENVCYSGQIQIPMVIGQG